MYETRHPDDYVSDLWALLEIFNGDIVAFVNRTSVTIDKKTLLSFREVGLHSLPGPATTLKEHKLSKLYAVCMMAEHPPVKVVFVLLYIFFLLTFIRQTLVTYLYTRLVNMVITRCQYLFLGWFIKRGKYVCRLLYPVLDSTLAEVETLTLKECDYFWIRHPLFTM